MKGPSPQLQDSWARVPCLSFYLGEMVHLDWQGPRSTENQLCIRSQCFLRHWANGTCPLMQINHLSLSEMSAQEGCHLSSGAGPALDRRSAAGFATPGIQIALREATYWMTQNRSFCATWRQCREQLAICCHHQRLKNQSPVARHIPTTFDKLKRVGLEAEST